MARGKVQPPWEEEVTVWEFLNVKKEPLYMLPPKLLLSEYRLRQSKKRFLNLSYAEWTLLPENLRHIHPTCSRYAEERRKEAASDRQPSTNAAIAAYFGHLASRVIFGDSYRPMGFSKVSYGTRQKVVIDAIRRQEPELAALQEAFEQETANRQHRFEEICSLLNQYVQV